MASTQRSEPPAGARVPAVEVFLGKGGVGKTTCAAATALALADAGQPCLALSTDPTPSLSHIFEVEGAHREREVAERLYITELGLAAVRRMWDERFGREVYAVFSAFVDIDYPAFVEFVTAVLPGLAEEFMVDYIRRLAAERRYARLVWDTAPLGQTLALLGMPGLLEAHLRAAPRIYAHLKGTGEARESLMTVIGRWRELSTLCLAFLAREVRFSMVTIPEALAVRQLEGVVAELARHGIGLARLIVNHVAPESDSPFLATRRRAQAPQLEFLRTRFAGLPLVEVPEFPAEVRGLEALRRIGARLAPAADARGPA